MQVTGAVDGGAGAVSRRLRRDLARGLLGEHAGALDVGVVRQRHAHAALDEALGLAEQAHVGARHAQRVGHAVERDALASTPP